jgi:phosphoglycolate phosphatase-like HAD superfamily hydrolase
MFEQEGRAASLSKPNPFMLDEIAKKYREPFEGCYYVGDMPDDMLAAAGSQANFKGVGIVLSAPDKESLKEGLLKAGADFVVESLTALKEIIL